MLPDLQTPIREFADAAAMMAHYAELRARLRSPPPKPVALPVPVVKLEPAPLPAPPADAPDLFAALEMVDHTPENLEEFLEQISCGKLVASRANGMRLAKLLEAHHRLPHGCLRGRSRVQPITRARQEWYWILVRQWGWPYGQTGRYTGFDHTTVIHGVARHAARLARMS
ncbi:Chromosomal replication initiator, DnaA C-terminal [uncultured Caudovirales phage]|uniref:Chromosomal replication initiator, DnaA C-terminal n=1 Tax=uncultured Caudovirales phage TaxID=2100421 RepID=A0A6J5KSA9_9CAUD|nr:Chromosomal replication initiator, DnaA C-terminal [uncultured Caudovirales phage]